MNFVLPMPAGPSISMTCTESWPRSADCSKPPGSSAPGKSSQPAIAPCTRMGGSISANASRSSIYCVAAQERGSPKRSEARRAGQEACVRGLLPRHPSMTLPAPPSGNTRATSSPLRNSRTTKPSRVCPPCAPSVPRSWRRNETRNRSLSTLKARPTERRVRASVRRARSCAGASPRAFALCIRAVQSTNAVTDIGTARRRQGCLTPSPLRPRKSRGTSAYGARTKPSTTRRTSGMPAARTAAIASILTGPGARPAAGFTTSARWA